MKLKGKDVLILDDDPDIGVLVSKVLINTGMNCQIATSIAQAKSILEKKPPHLLVLDLKLKEETGFEFLNFLNVAGYLKSIMVLVVSGYSNSSNISKAKSMGAKDYYVKPIKGPELLQKVKQIFHGDDTDLKYIVPEDSENLKLQGRIKGFIRAINHTSYLYESACKFIPNEAIKSQSFLFKKIKAENFGQITRGNSETIEIGLYQTEIAFQGVSKEMTDIIRGFSVSENEARKKEK